MTWLSIDLNADVGERPAALADGSEEALIVLLSSINVACGGHAGDDDSMTALARLARRHGLALGAHPGYADRENFGRLEKPPAPAEIERVVREQVERLTRIAAAEGMTLRQVKPHGALYNQAAGRPDIAEAIGRGVEAWRGRLRLVGLAGTEMLVVWRRMGHRVTAEAFADRRYEADGRLRARRYADALIVTAAEAARQAVEIVIRQRVIACGGQPVPVEADTLCIHGDTPGAAELAGAVRNALAEEGVEIRAPAEP